VNVVQSDHAADLGQATSPKPWPDDESTRADLMVIGLGYVGLPLAREAAFSGLTVVGFDLNTEVVAGLNAGRSHIGDVSASDVAEMLRKGFRATSCEEETGNPGTVVICVPTPLSADSGPDLTAIRGAVDVTGRILRPGTLVVLESTTYPGTTDEVVRPLLEKASGLTAGVDFSLAFSPERIDPGNPHYSIRNTPKVVGGQTSSCADAALRFYGQLCDQVVRARSAREAEMTKLLENTYRHINIALVNEMAIFCHDLGIDLRDAIRCAATKPFGFQAFYPGPGVGGHCIPIDPNYLSYKVRTLGYPFRFVDLAQEINGRMPGYVVDRAAELLNSRAKPLNGARVLLLGVTYKRDVADQRESPVKQVARKLRGRGAVLSYHDPFVPHWRIDGTPVRCARELHDEVALADLVILLQDHSGYDLDRISRAAGLVLDTRGRLAGPDVEPL
jgi:nucleotide sugar dehydrogenase